MQRMMRIFPLAALAITVPLFGQDIATKIAFIDTTAVLQGTAEGKAELGSIEKWVTGKRQELESQRAEVEDLKNTYNRQMRMLNPDTSAEMQRQIADKDRRVRRAQEDLELELNQRQNAMLTKMSQKIQAVIAEYAEQNGYGAVFLQSPSLPYFSESLEITATIIRIYDEKNPAAAEAAAAPSP